MDRMDELRGECTVVRMGKMVWTGCRERCMAMNGCSIEEERGLRGEWGGGGGAFFRWGGGGGAWLSADEAEA